VLQCGAALRLGELVALEVGDLSFEPKGFVLTIRRSKTESRRRWRDCCGFTGAEEGSCPVGALRRWLETAAIGAGLVVFRRTDRHADLGPTLSYRALPRSWRPGLPALRRFRRAFVARRVRDGGRAGRPLGGVVGLSRNRPPSRAEHGRRFSLRRLSWSRRLPSGAALA
jgi:hypothetical protein